MVKYKLSEALAGKDKLLESEAQHNEPLCVFLGREQHLTTLCHDFQGLPASLQVRMESSVKTVDHIFSVSELVTKHSMNV